MGLRPRFGEASSTWACGMRSRFGGAPSGPPGPDGARPVSDVGTAVPDTAWTYVTWATGTKGPLAARAAAARVRPVNSRCERWLLCERSLATDERKYYLLNLDATATLHDLIHLGRSRWPIEQQYPRYRGRAGLRPFRGADLPRLDASRGPHRHRVSRLSGSNASGTGTAHAPPCRPCGSGCARSWACCTSSIPNAC